MLGTEPEGDVMAEDDRILEELRALRSAVDDHRAETRASFRAVRAQLNALEFGVLTIAQRLLAESEVAEVQERMRATG
jgi:hypothetical protein